MPPGEQPVGPFVPKMVEIVADIYTEAIKPLYWQVVVLLTVYCLIRWAQRSAARRHHDPPRTCSP